MSDDSQRKLHQARRRFVGLGILGLAVAPLGYLVREACAGGAAPNAGRSGIPSLPEDDGRAMALSYTADTATLDPARYPYMEGTNCRSCQAFGGGSRDDWGRCAIFSARLHPTLNQPYVVSAKGWCKSWAARAA